MLHGYSIDRCHLRRWSVDVGWWWLRYHHHCSPRWRRTSGILAAAAICTQHKGGDQNQSANGTADNDVDQIAGCYNVVETEIVIIIGVTFVCKYRGLNYQIIGVAGNCTSHTNNPVG